METNLNKKEKAMKDFTEDNIKVEISEENNWIEIESIVVDHDRRGNGFGTTKINDIVSWAKESGYDGVFLTAFPESNDDGTITGKMIKKIMVFYRGLGLEEYYSNWDNLIDDDEEYVHQTGLCQGSFEYSIMEIEP